MPPTANPAPAWTRRGSDLHCPVAVWGVWLETARIHAQHRLRAARSRSFGFLHPTDVRVDTGGIALVFAPGALDGQATPPRSFGAWRDRWLVPLLGVLLECGDQGVAGLAHPGVVAARWVPPVEWFLPPATGTRQGADPADVRALVDWLDRETRADRTGPGVASIRDALAGNDLVRLRGLLTETAFAARGGEELAPPSFLTLLTEGELLERAASVYRYRLLRPGEVEDLLMDPRGQLVLEVDRSWEDPHFPGLTRPSPQEVWDALIDESKVVPILAASAAAPDPLRAGLHPERDRAVRWIGVHADQPLIFVRPDAGSIPPPRGFVRLHLAGDNTLMKRKRAFTDFAGAHPALVPWLESAPVATPFRDNPQPRADLEEAILATRGLFTVQGPPGTGKTHLATEVVRRCLARTPGARVLVCAKEHFALDHILRKIADALEHDGVPFRAWRSLSLARLRRTRGEDDRWRPRSVLRDLGARTWDQAAAGWEQWQAATSEQHDLRLNTLGQQSANLFFATTTDASMVEFLHLESFDLVVVEEAGKCYPSELLHAACLGRTTLMIGDHRQLPPYQERRTREALDVWQRSIGAALRDPRLRAEMGARFGFLFRELEALARDRGPLTEAERGWLRPFEFLFDRLTTRHRLEEQFRMEAPLSRAVGTVFYGRPFEHRKHELVDAGKLPARPLGDALPAELDVPMLWIDTPHMTVEPDATEDHAKRGVRDNAYELRVVLAYLARLRPGPPLDLVILTPYNAQKRLFLDSAELRATCARLTSTPFESVVRTVDEYQGRESELTVVSLVRNNSLGDRAWGFITELERLNVMFSRTRFRQVVVGCGAHIERHAEACPWLHQFWLAYAAEAQDPSNARILRGREVLGG